jgi:2-oxoglutarate dehydrogenase E2 component (dihydrolipoamide succinyltransferase)
MDVKVPSVGESITEGTLARWLKQDGAMVKEGEPIFELETEKATTEVPAPVSGVLHVRVKEGQTVAIGTVVASIEEKATAAPAAGKPKKEAAAAAAREPKKETVAQRPEAPLSPAARRLAAEKHVDAGALSGTGRGGLITKEDVQLHLDRAEKKEEAPAPLAAAKPEADGEPRPQVAEQGKPRAAARETRRPMSAIRQRIAERLVGSQKNTATLTTFNEADMSGVLALRARFKDRFRERHQVNLGLMSFFVKACVEGLHAYPVVHSWIDRGDIVEPGSCNIGVAVSTEKGLMVPVLRDADRMSFSRIEKAIAELADKARAGKINVQDLQGGTFTITNGGVFGSLLSTPILNPPQSAILGMHTIQKRPVAVDDQVVIRPMMYLALSYDHRLIDGRDAVLFLVRVKECIEAPERLLLEA